MERCPFAPFAPFTPSFSASMPATTQARLEKAQQILRAKLRGSHSRFADAPIVCVAAAVGGEKVAAVGAATFAEVRRRVTKDVMRK